MTAEAIGVIIGTGVGFITLVGSIFALVFNIGALKGQMTAHMAITQRDRADMLKDMGRVEERLEKHVDGHDRRAV